MSTKRPEDLYFTRMHVRNWRNFRDAEVRLERRAFFIGPNASGKSNLLDALRFLRDLVKPVGGGLGAAVEERGGLSSLRCLQAKGRNSQVEIEVDVGTTEEPTLWTYHLEFTQRAKENVTVLAERVSHRGSRVGNFERENHYDPLRASQTLIEQVTQSEQFRDLVRFFGDIRYLNIVPQIVRDTRRSLERGDDPFGGDLLRRVAETMPRTRDARLKRISEALSLAVPQFVDLKFERDDADGRPHLAAGFKHWRLNPSYQREDLFSDGTLRLIGFLWSIAEKGGPLLLEEPEQSLHEAITRQLPLMIARMQRKTGRQALISTHSEALLANETISLTEVHRLIPSTEGTTILSASNEELVRELTEAGLTVGEAAMPLTRPASVEGLPLFDVAG